MQINFWASLVVQSVKNPPVIQETWIRSLGWEDPLEEGIAIHSSILAWRILIDRGDWQTAVRGVTKTKQSSEVDCSQLIGPILQLGKMELRKMR